MHTLVRLLIALTIGIVLLCAVAIYVTQREGHDIKTHSNRQQANSGKAGQESVSIGTPASISGAGLPPNRAIEMPAQLPKKLSEATQRHRETVLLKNQYLLERIEIDRARLARLKDLLVERELSQVDAKESAKALGLPNAKIAEAANKAAFAVDEEIRASLGDEDYEKYAALAKESSYRGMIKRDFEGYLADAGAALTTEQGDILARVFTDVVYREKTGRELSASSISGDSMLRANEIEFLRRIAGIVSSNQLDLIERRFKSRNTPPSGRRPLP